MSSHFAGAAHQRSRSFDLADADHGNLPQSSHCNAQEKCELNRLIGGRGALNPQ